MNKTDIVQIMSWRSTKLAVTSVVFIAMMVYLVPILINEADARTKVTITSTTGPFYNSDVHLVRGKFWSAPTYSPPDFPFVVKWTSWGGPPLGGGSEIGRFTADVYLGGAGYGHVVLEYTNPASGRGDNTCKVVTAIRGVSATCYIPPRGDNVDAVFTVFSNSNNQGNDNGYCDTLKLGGIEQTKAIREKLRC